MPADLILVELLDEQNNPVAEGEEGEVVITTLGRSCLASRIATALS